MRSKALADLDALFARIDQDPDLCGSCKYAMSLRPIIREVRTIPACTCPPISR